MRFSVRSLSLLRACALLGLFAASGCVRRTPYVTPAEWPDEAATPLVVPSMEAGAALAAAAAIREVIVTNDDPRLFRGCSSPEQGLNAVVFKQPESGLYYVVVEQRFDRCGGPSGRVLDWWREYAVTAQGKVVARAPPGAAQPSSPSPVPPPNRSSPVPPLDPPPRPEAPPAAQPVPDVPY